MITGFTGTGRLASAAPRPSRYPALTTGMPGVQRELEKHPAILTRNGRGPAARPGSTVRYELVWRHRLGFRAALAASRPDTTSLRVVQAAGPLLISHGIGTAGPSTCAEPEPGPGTLTAAAAARRAAWPARRVGATALSFRVTSRSRTL